MPRTLTGDVAGMMQGARTVLGRPAFNPLFIGDEVYWRVTPENPSPAGPILTTTPQVNRIAQFDAVTSHIFYYGDPEWLLGPTGGFTGYPGTTEFVADERHLMSEYGTPTGGPLPVIPDIASGFNDRGSAWRRTIRPSHANGCPARARPRRSTISSAVSPSRRSPPPCPW